MLDNGFWGSMSKPVLAHYQQQSEMVNRDNAWYARRHFVDDIEAARAAAAVALGVHVDEIVLTRGATEALQALIAGYNRLQAGDTVLCADIDYDNMITVMRWLKQRRGVEVVEISMPEPFTHDGVIDAYAQAMARHPKLKLMLLTHVNHRNGMVLPVAEISRLARERGIDVIVDAAHSWRQLDFALPDLDCDFVGLNGHKWLAAPLGVGVLHIRKSALDRIDHDLATASDAPDVISERIHTGTLNAAAFLTVPSALAFETRIGLDRKSARLRALRDRWVEPARAIPGIEILTPDEPGLYGAITAFRITGQTSMRANEAIARQLLDRHRIFTVARGGVDRGGCVRVTPNLFNTMQEMDFLAGAIANVVRTLPDLPTPKASRDSRG